MYIYVHLRDVGKGLGSKHPKDLAPDLFGGPISCHFRRLRRDQNIGKVQNGSRSHLAYTILHPTVPPMIT